MLKDVFGTFEFRSGAMRGLAERESRGDTLGDALLLDGLVKEVLMCHAELTASEARLDDAVERIRGIAELARGVRP